MLLILASSSPRRRELLSSLGIPFTIVKPDIDETQRPGEAPLDYVCRLSREKAQAVASEKLYPSTVQRAHGELKSPSLCSGEGFGEGIILAADTVVILGSDTLGVDEQGDILGKPADAAEARDMLRRLRGRTHQVCTAITLHALNAEIDNSARAVFSPSPYTGRGEPNGDACPLSVSGGGVEKILTRLTCTNVTMRDYTDAEIDTYIATGDPFDKAGSYAIQHPVFQPVARIDGCYTNVVGLPLCTLKTMLAEIGWPGIEAAAGCDCGKALFLS